MIYVVMLVVEMTGGDAEVVLLEVLMWCWCTDLLDLVTLSAGNHHY